MATRPGSTRSPRGAMSRFIWLVAALTTAIAVAVVGVFGIGLYRYATADHLGVLDDPVVIDAANAACAQMAKAVHDQAAPPGASASAVAETIRRQNVAITSMVSDIRELGSDRLRHDHPAVGWLADWEALVTLREVYADALSNGERPTVVIPESDGVPITERMDDVGLSESCVVAAELARPTTGVY